MQKDSERATCLAEVLPPPEDLDNARAKLVDTLPKDGIGLQKIQDHIQRDLVPAFERHNKSPNYYGFVTGGTTPAATFGDQIAVEHDQTAQVYLPKESIAVEVEDRALRMLCELSNLAPDEWSHRTLTTGATASNVMGLACGREYAIQQAAFRNGVGDDISVADYGLIEAMRLANIEKLQILTTVPHSSLRKAASIVGLGRSSVKDVGLSSSSHCFDMEALEAALSEPKVASIVAISCAEVNTGFFATNAADMHHIRTLCDKYGAWLHVDAAFGLMARVLPSAKHYERMVEGVAGLDLADSITGDAHKLLNVPYDCGILLSRHLPLGTQIFQNTNAAYLTPANISSTAGSMVPSPLNIGIENSRRFRALPVYATLAAYGREGYRDMMERQIQLARLIAQYIDDSTAYELLPQGNALENVYIIVLFRAKNPKLNVELVQRINSTRRIYVSGTQWEGKPAARFAVASWQVQPQREIATIRSVLDEVVQ